MTESNPRKGIGLMILTMAVFASQDGISRHLAGEYNTTMVVMIRYWFFATFVVAVSSRRARGLRQVARTRHPVLQTTRGLLLAAEVCVLVFAFTILGLIESLAIFICYPLIVAALSGPVLGEKVGPYRWAAIAIGFVGILVVLRPGFGVFSPYALIALCSAAMFALYTLLTRYVSRADSAATSFFWTGVPAAIALTPVGLWFWEPMVPRDWGWMAVLCMTGALGHYLLIRTYEIAEASAVQPYAYLQLVFASGIGLTIFNETLRANVLVGATIVITAGLFTLWRENRHANP